MNRHFITIAACIALTLFNSPASADELKGAVQTSDSPMRLARPEAEQKAGIVSEESVNLFKNAKLSAALGVGGKRHCNCSSQLLKHFTNHCAPRYTGTLTETSSGRVIGMLEDEKGKYVFVEFVDTRLLSDPAWSNWLQRLRDCLQQQWISRNFRDCEFLLHIAITPDGRIRLLRTLNSGFYPVLPGEPLAEPVLVDNDNRWFREHLDVFSDFLSMDGDPILKFPRTEKKDVGVYLWYQNKTYPNY